MSASASPRPLAAPEGRASELVGAAYALIAERGLEGLRTRDIAARVGINIATLHYYFPSKQALVLAVVERVSEMFQTIVATDHPADSTVIERSVRNTQHRRRAAPELQIVMLELDVRAYRDEVVAAAMSQIHIIWRARIERELRDDMTRGVLRADLDPGAAAAILTSVLIGSSVQLQLNPRAFSFDAMLLHLHDLWRIQPGAGIPHAKKKQAARPKVAKRRAT